MFQRLASVLAAAIILVLAIPSLAGSVPSADEPSTQGGSTLMKRVLEIPAGSPVEVKVSTKEKVRG